MKTDKEKMELEEEIHNTFYGNITMQEIIKDYGIALNKVLELNKNVWTAYKSDIEKIIVEVQDKHKESIKCLELN